MEQDTLDQTLNLHISWLLSAFLLSKFIGILVYWCPVNEKAEAAECRALLETQISKFNGEADPKSPQWSPSILGLHSDNIKPYDWLFYWTSLLSSKRQIRTIEKHRYRIIDQPELSSAMAPATSNCVLSKKLGRSQNINCWFQQTNKHPSSSKKGGATAMSLVLATQAKIFRVWQVDEPCSRPRSRLQKASLHMMSIKLSLWGSEILPFEFVFVFSKTFLGLSCCFIPL